MKIDLAKSLFSFRSTFKNVDNNNESNDNVQSRVEALVTVDV